MSNDTNYISPNHNAAVLEPLPELTSDETYIQARKDREKELYTDPDFMRDEVIPACLTDEFIRNFSSFLASDVGGVQSVMLLAKACISYVQSQARIDVDDLGDEL